MAPFEVTGKLKVKMEEQSFSSGFTKREFVLTTEEQYPQDIKFELIKDKTSVIDRFNPNDTIKVSFNLRGNEYNGKYYVNLQAWRVEAGENAGAPIPPPLDPMAEPVSAPSAPPSHAGTIDDIGEDDLPF
jgi:single-strand DNA-binding protein